MSKKKSELQLEQEKHEKEARINALNQLLENSQADVVKGYEGLLSQAEYEKVKSDRAAWHSELNQLNNEGEISQSHRTPDVYALVNEIVANTQALDGNKVSQLGGQA